MTYIIHGRSVSLCQTHFHVFYVCDFILLLLIFPEFWYQMGILRRTCIPMPSIVISATVNQNIETQLYFIKYLQYLDVFHNCVVDFKQLLVIWEYIYILYTYGPNRTWDSLYYCHHEELVSSVESNVDVTSMLWVSCIISMLATVNDVSTIYKIFVCCVSYGTSAHWY